jgi:tRNA-specific 2-thiouridylase
MFPLGEMSKPEVRHLARSSDLDVAEKAESQEICFVPDGDYAGFLDRYLTAENRIEQIPAEGELIDAQGRVVGRHDGIHRFTVGQRRGIGIAAERPLYVLSIDAPGNKVVVGSAEELLREEFTAAGVNWIAFDEPDIPTRAEVRVRYRHEAAPATIVSLPQGRVRVTFDAPQRAITPGQATVFYRGDEVVGGGWIVKSQ